MLHQLLKFRKQFLRIVRTGRSLRVILHAEGRKLPVPYAFNRVVVQIDMSEFETIRQIRERKVVILARDRHASRPDILHRMIASVMAELEPSAFRPAGETEQLMPEADPHERHLAQQKPDVLDRVDGIVNNKKKEE